MYNGPRPEDLAKAEEKEQNRESVIDPETRRTYKQHGGSPMVSNSAHMTLPKTAETIDGDRPLEDNRGRHDPQGAFS
ncbi:uncharacterized protein A4U43_C01F2110 [Asparagus officinalis]|uniref:Uncharacterized protein n=1 Tax=Asparagus officinalis TaxID=4686 RepID=A0A5P1FL25_ASPOF|nr:uncharacterized protein A4U43_C01F2110 [Asparagus officinalis]